MGDGVWLAGWWPVSGVTNTPTTHEAGLSTVSDSVHTRCRPATMQPTVSYTLFMLIGDGMPPQRAPSTVTTDIGPLQYFTTREVGIPTVSDNIYTRYIVIVQCSQLYVAQYLYLLVMWCYPKGDASHSHTYCWCPYSIMLHVK
jgi:hypothetical protein